MLEPMITNFPGSLISQDFIDDLILVLLIHLSNQTKSMSDSANKLLNLT